MKAFRLIDDECDSHTKKISEILDTLIDNKTYDKRLRPNYGTEPVNVGITIHVSSVSAVSEVNMDFTIDFYLRQTWNDPRLAFRHYLYGIFENDIDSLTVGVDYLQKLWKPDTFFPNEKKSYFHITTTHNSFLRIYPNGNVFTSQRLTVTATCNMKLQLFPMDSQRCKLEIESYGYSALDIVYYFNNSKAISKSDFELPQFVLVDMQVASRNIVLSSGNYSRLTCAFLFKRNIGFYIIQIYLPSTLIVVISWVSFWLNRDATPARVALSVLTILTMTTLTATTNASLPKVSYVKSIDIFLGVSFVMVFSSLLEFAAVGYISKRIKVIEKKRQDMQRKLSNIQELREATVSNYFYTMPSATDNAIIPLYHPFYSSRDKNSNLYNGGEINPPVILKKGECQCPIPPPSPTSIIHIEEKPKEEYMLLFCVIRPSEIDKYSRSIFPLIIIYTDIMVNISQDLLDRFYDLADFEENRRHTAILSILDQFEKNGSYCIERLVAGLASSRAAARLGYSNALTIILSSFGKDWPIEMLLKLADEKLPLNKESPGSVLGQHLLHLALVNSNAYSQALCEIGKREMSLAEKQSGLSYAITDLLAQCSNKLGEKKFAKEFWPFVKENVTKPLDSLSPEWFYFALNVMEKHSDTLKTEVSFLSSSGQLFIADKDFDMVINILKVISRALPFINTMLHQIDFEPIESLTTKEWRSTDTAKLLDSFDRIGGGNFDEFIGGNVKITEKILFRLRDDVHSIVIEALKEGGWRLRRIANVFLHWPTDIREIVLKLLFEHGNWTEEIRNAFCSSVASLFTVNVRAGRSVTSTYKAEHKKLLQKLVKKQDIGVKLPITSNGILSIFLNVIALWIAAASDSNERQAYLRDFAETRAISEKMAENDSDSIAVLNDLLLSLLSRPHRYHRSVVHYVFASFIPKMNLENILQIFETINLSNEELMQEKDASESDDEDGGDYEDSEQTSEKNEIINNGGAIERHEETDVSEYDEENEEESEVDEEFISNLKSALGPAAERSDDDSDENSASSTVSDETMFRLDEGLAAVFRKKRKNSRTLNATLVEQAQQLRAKCFDLLLIAVSHQEGTYKAADLILPLIECAQQALRRKDSELTFKKATNLLEIIIKHKKSELNEESAIKLLDELVLAASQTVNPVMRSIFGSVAGCYDAKENVVAVNMRVKVVELLEKYMSDKNNQLLIEIVAAPFIKYPHALLNELPRIIDFAFDKNIRTFQRVEALSCAVAFLRKDLVKGKESDQQKMWKKITKCLCLFASKFFSELNLDDSKPRFFAYLVRVLTSFASITDESNKKRLQQSLVGALKELCNNAELWKMSDRLRRFNGTSQSICGRKALASLKYLLSILEH
uniref:Gamma-aminobutyric acid receptor subunit beta n=1 Tax=Setaria digitata TaxID=48799 RepID=A0A915PSG0_9BILA